MNLTAGMVGQRGQGLTRRRSLQWALASQLPGLAAMALAQAPAHAQAPAQGNLPLVPPLLPAPTSLPLEQRQAQQRKQPLVVLVSLVGCPFCKIVREHYLAPMRQQDGLPVVQLDMQSRAAVAGWDGRPSTHAELIDRWRIKVAPTVLFFGADGKELAERLEGLGSGDFYEHFLQQRLVQARAALLASAAGR